MKTQNLDHRLTKKVTPVPNQFSWYKKSVGFSFDKSLGLLQPHLITFKGHFITTKKTFE